MTEGNKINIEMSTGDRLLENLGWVIVVLMWVFLFINYAKIPETIPTHFDAAGKPDDFGSKLSFIIIPIIGTALFIGLTILNRFPHIFNYPIKITEENKEKQFRLATRMIRVLKLSLAIVFLLLMNMIYRSAFLEQGNLNAWFLPVTLTLIFVPIIAYFIQAFKSR